MEVISALLQEVTEAIKEHNQPEEKEKVDIPMILRPALAFQPQKQQEQQQPKEVARALSVDGVSSFEHQAMLKGIKVGVYATMKRSEPNPVAGAFKSNVIDSYVCLTEVDHFKDNDDLMTIKTEFKDFAQKWTTYKAEVPQRLQGGWSLAYMSSQAEVEAFRAKLYIELRQLADDDENPPLGELLSSVQAKLPSRCS